MQISKLDNPHPHLPNLDVTSHEAEVELLVLHSELGVVGHGALCIAIRKTTLQSFPSVGNTLPVPEKMGRHCKTK